MFTVTVTDQLRKFGPVLFRPFPATYPENGMNLRADLVVAFSLLVTELEMLLLAQLLRLREAHGSCVHAKDQCCCLMFVDVCTIMPLHC